jgi:hypothetical protein
MGSISATGLVVNAFLLENGSVKPISRVRVLAAGRMTNKNPNAALGSK